MEYRNIGYVMTDRIKAGDLIRVDSGIVQASEDAKLTGSKTSRGEAIYGCESVCIRGSVPCYFSPGSAWWVQGTAALSHALVEPDQPEVVWTDEQHSYLDYLCEQAATYGRDIHALSKKHDNLDIDKMLDAIASDIYNVPETVDEMTDRILDKMFKDRKEY